MILNIFFVGIGGALGAILRFGVNEIFEKQLLLSSIFGTLFINIVGCFLIGLVAGITLPDKNTTFYFFIIGFLGSFTTMSAFSHQVNLMINSNLIGAISYIMLTVLFTILATYFGAVLSKQ